MILEDVTSIIDHDLGKIAFGKPFIEETGLGYDKKEGTIVFREYDEKITFKITHRMGMFEHIDPKDMNIDPIPAFVLENINEHEKVYYSNSLIIGPEFKQNESVNKEIRHLMKIEREASNKSGGVTKYLMDMRTENFDEKTIILYSKWRRRLDFPDGVWIFQTASQL
nr:hypothetical protein [Tanacetum cinerariifolium]